MILSHADRFAPSPLILFLKDYSVNVYFPINWWTDNIRLNVPKSMHQIAYFDSHKRKKKEEKNPGVGEGISPPTPHPIGWFAPSPVILLLEKDYSVNVYFPIYCWIDNIPTNSPKVCTRSLTLIPQNARTPWFGRGIFLPTSFHALSLDTLVGHSPLHKLWTRIEAHWRY